MRGGEALVWGGGGAGVSDFFFSNESKFKKNLKKYVWGGGGGLK